MIELIVIRQPVSSLYRCADGTWTDDPRNAETFALASEALKTCLRLELEVFQIAILSDDFQSVIELEKTAPETTVNYGGNAYYFTTSKDPKKSSRL